LSFFVNIGQACLGDCLPDAHFGGRQQSGRQECLSCQQMNFLDNLNLFLEEGDFDLSISH
jgi:hypothetical protein